MDSTAPGIFLVVFDLATHTVYDEQATTLFRSRGNFEANTQLQRDGLRDVLDTLDESHVAILVSTGDISAMATDVNLSAKIREFGGSTLFEQLDANSAYSLIGMKNLSSGDGLEQVAGPERSGVVTQGTVAIDASVIGFSAQQGVPPGNIALFDGDCPPGWSEYTAAQGRTILGLPAGGTPGGTLGTALGDLASRTINEVVAHSHPISPPPSDSAGDHTHSYTAPGGNILVGSPSCDSYGCTGTDVLSSVGATTEAAGGHSHTTPTFSSETVGSSTVDVTMPYVQLRVCRKD